MCIPIHSDLLAQPHRIKYIRQALEYVLGHREVWQVTAAEIAEYYLEHHYDRVMAHISSRQLAEVAPGPN